MHQNTQCDVCKEWKMERKAWLAKDEAEMREILADPDYQAAMKRLFELRSEIASIDAAWPGWPKELTTYFNQHEPLAKMVESNCPPQEGEKKYGDYQKEAKKPNPKPYERRLLDEVIIRHSGGADGCGDKSARNTPHTENLLTDMLRCFPTNLRGEPRLNPLLDFLCWYHQHITLAAQADVTTRSLFYQALCAPMVNYQKADGKKDALPAGIDPELEFEVKKHKAIYQSIDTAYTQINKAAETAFAALVADLQVPEAESVLHRHDQELYARWKAMYYPQRS